MIVASASKGGSKVKPPKALVSADPRYSKEAEAQHIEGISKLVVLVGIAGPVEHIAVLEPLGMGLDEEAVRTVAGWKFQPATRDGNPFPAQIDIEIDFRCCP